MNKNTITCHAKLLALLLSEENDKFFDVKYHYKRIKEIDEYPNFSEEKKNFLREFSCYTELDIENSIQSLLNTFFSEKFFIDSEGRHRTEYHRLK